MLYGPALTLLRRARIYHERFGNAPFQRLYSKQNHFNLPWAVSLILSLFLLALLNLYLLALPLAGLAALTAAHMVHGVKVARHDERLRPAWRWEA